MYFTVLAIFIGILFQPCLLMITPDPVGPGFDCADPSVKTNHGFVGTCVQDEADVVLHIVGII